MVIGLNVMRIKFVISANEENLLFIYQTLSEAPEINSYV